MVTVTRMLAAGVGRLGPRRPGAGDHEAGLPQRPQQPHPGIGIGVAEDHHQVTVGPQHPACLGEGPAQHPLVELPGAVLARLTPVPTLDNDFVTLVLQPVAALHRRGEQVRDDVA
jgi:hypothetical protein